MSASPHTVCWSALQEQVLTSPRPARPASEGNLQIVLRSRIITGLFGRGAEVGNGRRELPPNSTHSSLLTAAQEPLGILVLISIRGGIGKPGKNAPYKRELHDL